MKNPSEKGKQASRVAKYLTQQIAVIRENGTLMNDLLAQVFFRKQDVVQELLRVALELPELKVSKSEIQKSFLLPDSRGMISDIYALDAFGVHYGIEIQKEPSGAKATRIQLIFMRMLSDFTKPGISYDDTPRITIVFITETDAFATERMKTVFSDDTMKAQAGNWQSGMTTVLLNVEKADDSPLGLLLQDFVQSDPDKMYNPVFRTRMREVKCVQEEQKAMDQWTKGIYEYGKNDGREEGREEGEQSTIRQIVRRMKQKGYSLDNILEITGLSMQQINML